MRQSIWRPLGATRHGGGAGHGDGGGSSARRRDAALHVNCAGASVSFERQQSPGGVPGVPTVVRSRTCLVRSTHTSRLGFDSRWI